MTVAIIVQPSPLVSLADAKLELGIDHMERDAQIDRFVLAAQAEMDGPFGWVGVSIAPQTLEYRLAGFRDTICLPYGPVIDPIVSLRYLDAAGAEQELSPDDYALLDGGRLVPAQGAAWPATLDQADAVRIVYDVGIVDETDTRVQVMKTAILMRVRMLMDMDDPAPHDRAIDNLLRQLKVWTL